MKKLFNKFTLPLLSLISISSFAANEDQNNQIKQLNCEYVISNEWDTGFTGLVQLTNISQDQVEGWSVQWILNSNIIHDSWNVQFESIELEQDSHLYIGSNLDWNEIIEPDSTIEFGFKGDKQESDIEIPVINGENCVFLKLGISGESND